MASDAIKDIDSSNFDEETKEGIVLVDFWAPWCGPCRMIAPILDKIADNLGSKAKVMKANLDDTQDIAVKHNIQSVPTLLIMKDGEIVERLTGLNQIQESIVLQKVKDIL